MVIFSIALCPNQELVRLKAYSNLSPLVPQLALCVKFLG